MKITKDQVIILGCHESKNNIKTVHAIGTQKFTLYKLELNDNVKLKTQNKIFIGEDSDKIKKNITKIGYHDLSNSEKNEIEKAVHSIIISNENRYIEFFNKQKKEGSRLHLLEGISRKSALRILDKKENGDFISFKDVEKRIDEIKNVEDLIAKRVLYEIIEMPQVKKIRPIYLFVDAKKTNIKIKPKLSKFEDDDSFFLEKLKKEGMIESSGKKLK